MIYFIQAGAFGPIKIGWSQEPEKRLAELQTALPTEARLLKVIPGERSEEQTLHTRFGALRIRHRGEWFWPAAQLTEFIEQAEGTIGRELAIPVLTPRSRRLLQYLQEYGRADEQALWREFDNVPRLADSIESLLKHGLIRKIEELDEDGEPGPIQYETTQ